MKSLIVGASKDIAYGSSLLKKYKIQSLAIDGNPQAEGFQFADKYSVVDISDEEKCINFAKDNDASFILPVPIGRYITTWGAINDSLGLKGISKEMGEKCTDKWLFHIELAKNSLRNAQAFLLTKGMDSLSREELNYPMILKPRFGSGSRGVKELMSFEEYQAEITLIDFEKEDYILESAVPGTEFGVDGIVLDGKCKVVLLREKINTPPPSRQAIGYYTGFDQDKFSNLEERVEKRVKSVVKTLGLNNCLFHVDVMVNDEDTFIIELSPRPSGHNLHNNFTIKATNYDMLNEYIKYQTNQSYSLDIPAKKNIAILYFDFENVEFLGVPQAQEVLAIEGVLEYTGTIAVGQTRGKISQGSDVIEDGFVIIQGQTREAINQVFEQIKNMFKIKKVQK